MTTSNLSIAKAISIVAKGGQSERIYDASQGIGDRGQATRIEAQSGDRFILRDPKSGRSPTGIRAKRVGMALHLYLAGSMQPDVLIDHYFDETIVAKPQFSLLGENEARRCRSWNFSRWLPPEFCSPATFLRSERCSNWLTSSKTFAFACKLSPAKTRKQVSQGTPRGCVYFQNSVCLLSAAKDEKNGNAWRICSFKVRPLWTRSPRLLFRALTLA